MKKYILIFFYFILFNWAYAQEPFVLSSKEKDTSSAELPNVSKLTLWGYADLYYAYNFNQPPSRVIGEMVNGNSNIFSFNRQNEFNLNNGILGLKYENHKARAAFSLQSGTYVAANYASEPDVFKNIFDAYAGYKLGKKAWVDAGIFASHIGSESALSFDCPTLSRSMMADNTPYYETGAKITFEATSKLTLTGLILNGWQNIIDHNKNKALGSQVQYKPVDAVLLNWSTFYGKEAGAYENAAGVVNTDSLSTTRFFNDFYMIADVTKKLTMTAAFDIGMQKKLNLSGNYVWYNPNLILRYCYTDKFAVAGRVEYYHDKNGVIINSGTPNGFQTLSGSVNVDFNLTKNIKWRVEGKFFNSKDKVYINEDHASKQSTLLMTSLAVKF